VIAVVSVLIYLFLTLAIAIFLIGWLGWSKVRPKLLLRRVRQIEREFARDRKALESQFFRAASQSGKPRGLAWKQCAFQDRVLFGRDRANGEIVGLVGATIGFEAVAGGGMEDVEAVGNLRAATAVFIHNGRQWTTQGKAIFNLEPREVLERYRASLMALTV
jgi:hypothetical protein